MPEKLNARLNSLSHPLAISATSVPEKTLIVHLFGNINKKLFSTQGRS
jgi:hypothetical protein